MSPHMRSEILGLLKNRDKVDHERTILDSSSFARYIFKIKSWEPERLKRSLTEYKLEHLHLDFFVEEEQSSKYYTQMMSKASIIITFIKNLFYPLKAHVIFQTNSTFTAKNIEMMIEDPISGIVDTMPEPSKIKGEENRYKIELKIDDEREFSSKLETLKTTNPEVEIYAIYDRPTIKTYIPIASAIGIGINYLYHILHP